MNFDCGLIVPERENLKKNHCCPPGEVRAKYLHPSSFWYMQLVFDCDVLFQIVVPCGMKWWLHKSFQRTCWGKRDSLIGSFWMVKSHLNNISILPNFLKISLGIWYQKLLFCLRMILTSWFSMFHLTKNKIYGVSATVIHLERFPFPNFPMGDLLGGNWANQSAAQNARELN